MKTDQVSKEKRDLCTGVLVIKPPLRSGSGNSSSGVLFLPKIRGIRFRGLNCVKNSKPDDLKNLIKSYQDTKFFSACGGLLSDKNLMIYL